MGSRLEANSNAVRKRIESHKFENEEGEEYEPSKFGGFTDYFRRKKIKLQNYDAELRSQGNKSPIFRGVVAHVNGYTQPSLNDLHKLIVSYGGGFMQYLDGKTTVTHIIASNLTPKKKVEFAKYRIVKPAWVVDSIEAGKLLAWDSYRLLDEGPGQRVLGFDNGAITSQVNDISQGYREQTDTSWYTSQVRSVAEKLKSKGHGVDIIAHVSQEDVDDIIDSELAPAADASLTESQNNTQRELDHVETDKEEEPVPQNVPYEDRVADADPPAPHLHDLDASPRREEELPGIEPVFAGGDRACESHKRPEDMTAEEHNAVLLADPKIWKSSVVNPGFLKQYYEESRLHHLSAWKAQLKAQIQALAAEKSLSQKTREKRPPGARRYILHADFDSFFVAVSLKKHPEFVDNPVVVAHGGGSGAEIASCNYPARKFGVKNGMWMKHAQKMCPDIKVLPYDFTAYEEASRHFYEAIIDTRGVVQSVSIDEALIDVSMQCIAAGGHDGRGVQEGSIWREQAKADEIAHNLRELVKEKTGCAISVGIGGNILLAKVAMRKAKPAGQYQIKPDEALDFLSDLTMQDLPGIAWSIGGKLEEIGVKFVKDVRQLSKERMISVLGPKTGEKVWDFSRGIDRIEVGDRVIRKSVSAEVNWGIRFVTQEQAEEFVQSLCDELHKRLLTEGVKGRQLTMKIMRRAADAPIDPPKHLGHGKCDTFNKSVVFGVSTNDASVLGREAISILRGWAFSPGELRGIGCQLQKLEPIKAIANGLNDSSQKRLQFKSSIVSKPTSRLPRDDTIIDDIDSPQKPKAQPPPHPAAAFAKEGTPGSKPRTTLNTMGTQFILPTQVDPETLAELPKDIRRVLFPKSKEPNPINVSEPVERPQSGALNRQPPLANTIPSASQIDPEILDNLPEDVRAEVLAHYTSSPKRSHNQAVLPQSPRKDRAIKLPKKLHTPTKKRGRPFGIATKASASGFSTLTQSNFVSGHAKSVGSAIANDTLDPEFLSALPPDMRREVLAQARRERLQKSGSLNLPASKRKFLKPNPQLPAGQRMLKLPPRPDKPYFTSRKITALPELRDALSAWYEEFSDEGPYAEDVEALAGYLGRVVREEEDMAKAVATVKWLKWIAEVGPAQSGMGKEEQMSWKDAVLEVENGVQRAVKARGLGEVRF